MSFDDWDPNAWAIDEHEHRIYANDTASIYAIVDAVDYQFFSYWRWSWKTSRGGRKIYLYRTYNSGPIHTSLFLHVAIMVAKGTVKPSSLHTIADHRDGDSLNCKRENMRWATPSMNRRNIYGQCGYDLIEDAVACEVPFIVP